LATGKKKGEDAHVLIVRGGQRTVMRRVVRGALPQLLTHRVVREGVLRQNEKGQKC